MPPRCSARLAAEADARASGALAPLPLALAQRIFASLPPDSRGRAACVCRSWRQLLANPALWTRLVWRSSNWDPARNDAVLRGVSGRARGQLCHLDVSDCISYMPRVLLAVIAANAGSLRELRVLGLHARRENDPCPALVPLLRAALLCVLDAVTFECDWEDAPRLVRSETPFTPRLRPRELRVQCGDGREWYGPPGGADRVTPYLAALADAAPQPTLTSLVLVRADLRPPEVMDALADAALAWRLRLRTLVLICCPTPAAAPLARLLCTSSLATFEYSTVGGAHARLVADAAGAALVAAALRASTSLTSLSLSNAGLCADPYVAAPLLGALVGHPTLKILSLSEEPDTEAFALGAALGALVAADAPALQELRLVDVALGGEGWAPLAAALPGNHHLRGLYAINTGMMPEFARTRLLPAVQANASLRELHSNGGGDPLRDASNLVANRPPVAGWVSTWELED